MIANPDSKVHGANMGPTWVLSAPDGTHVGPMNLAIRLGYVTTYVIVLVPCYQTKNLDFSAVTCSPGGDLLQSFMNLDRTRITS